MYMKVEIMKYDLMKSFRCSLVTQSFVNKYKLCVIEIQKVEQNKYSSRVFYLLIIQNSYPSDRLM